MVANLFGGDSGIAVSGFFPSPGGSPFLSPLLPDRSAPNPGATPFAGATTVQSNGDFWVDTQPGEAVVTAWDKLILAGTTFPGLWQLDIKLGREFEPTKWQTAFAPMPPQFINMITDKGYRPAVIQATGRIWTLSDWNTFSQPSGANFTGGGLASQGLGLAAFVPKPDASPSGTSPASAVSAFDIVHPGCSLLGIASVLIGDVHLLPIQGQMLTVEISMLQYFPRTQVFTRHSGGGATLKGGAAKVPGSGPK